MAYFLGHPVYWGAKNAIFDQKVAISQKRFDIRTRLSLLERINLPQRTLKTQTLKTSNGYRSPIFDRQRQNADVQIRTHIIIIIKLFVFEVVGG